MPDIIICEDNKEIGELLSAFLKKENVDLDKGFLTILGSKGQKDRLVYLPQDGISVIKDHKRNMEVSFPDSPWMIIDTEIDSTADMMETLIRDKRKALGLS